MSPRSVGHSFPSFCRGSAGCAAQTLARSRIRTHQRAVTSLASIGIRFHWRECCLQLRACRPRFVSAASPLFAMKEFRLNRLFHPRSKRCFDVAIDHGFFNERAFLTGIENLERSIRTLVEAGPDAIQLTIGQAPLL